MSEAVATAEQRTDGYVQALAELAVRAGANVQPGQIVAITSEPGKEQLARAVAEAAYKAGAKFVDLSVFDPYLKRARATRPCASSLSGTGSGCWRWGSAAPRASR